MIEAKIQCQCRLIALPDLGFDGEKSLKNGQVLYMDAVKARASKDLQRAWKSRAVTIKYVERCRERREVPMAPSVFHRARSMVAAPQEPASPTHDILLVDPDAIAARVVAELGRSPIDEWVKVEVAREVQALEDRLVTRITTAVLAGIQPLLSGAVLRTEAPSTSVGKVPTVDNGVPVYVPSKIGGTLKADLGLAPEKASHGGVSDAAAALRAARGKK